MEITLDLPDDLMREVKIRATQQGKKLKDVMEDILRSGLGATPQNIGAPRAIIAKHPVLGFPTVDCAPNSAASQMTLEELLQLEQDSLYQEDLQRVGIARTTDAGENHEVVFPDFNKLRKKLGTDQIDGVNEVIRLRSKGS